MSLRINRLSKDFDIVNNSIDTLNKSIKDEIDFIKEQLECPINLVDMKVVIAMIPCMHRISEEAWNTLKSNSTICPICRGNVTAAHPDPVFKATLDDLAKRMEKITQNLVSKKKEIISFLSSSAEKENRETDCDVSKKGGKVEIQLTSEAHLSQTCDSQDLEIAEKLDSCFSTIFKDASCEEISDEKYKAFLNILDQLNLRISGFDTNFIQNNLYKYAYIHAVRKKEIPKDPGSLDWGKIAIREIEKLPIEQQCLNNLSRIQLIIKPYIIFELNFYIHLLINKKFDFFKKLTEKKLLNFKACRESVAASALLLQEEIKNQWKVTSLDEMMLHFADSMKEASNISKLKLVLSNLKDNWEKLD